MSQKKRLIFAHVDEIDADVVELPYENDALSMIVVVPSNVSDVKNLADKLESFDFGKINEKLDQVRPESLVNVLGSSVSGSCQT